MGNWKYRLEADLLLRVPELPAGGRFENEWVKIDGPRMLIRKGYAWDGCSPSGLWWDTWDGPIDDETGKPQTYFASLAHDALYQFILEIRAALKISVWELRRRADRAFLREMTAAGFEHARLYFRIVRAIGWAPVLGKKIRTRKE